MLLRSSVSRFANRVLRSRAGLWLPDQDLIVPRDHNVLAVRRRNGGPPKLAASARNIVTNDGDLYYAELGAEETATNAFANLYLSSVAWSPSPSKTSTVDDLASVISGSESAAEAGYPQTDDQDADNTGAGTDIVTWKYAYAAGDFNDSDIEGAAITVASETNWGGATGNPVLTAFDFTSFAKTASDTLTVYVNHTFTGV